MPESLRLIIPAKKLIGLGLPPLSGHDEIGIPPPAFAKLAGIVTSRPGDAMVAPSTAILRRDGALISNSGMVDC